MSCLLCLWIIFNAIWVICSLILHFALWYAEDGDYDKPSWRYLTIYGFVWSLDKWRPWARCCMILALVPFTLPGEIVWTICISFIVIFQYAGQRDRKELAHKWFTNAEYPYHRVIYSYIYRFKKLNKFKQHTNSRAQEDPNQIVVQEYDTACGKIYERRYSVREWDYERARQERKTDKLRCIFSKIYRIPLTEMP